MNASSSSSSSPCPHGWELHTRYNLLSTIGRGAHGVAYLAQDKQIGAYWYVSIDRSIDRESRVSCHVQEGECNIGEKGETGRASFRGGEPTGRVYFMYIYKCINITLYSTCRMIRIDECAGMQRIYIRYRRLRYIERNGRMTMTTMMMMDLWVVVVML